jgi:hypothetical protein
MILGGFAMQYVWDVVSPSDAFIEMHAHEGLYNAQLLNQDFDPSEANPRVDIFIIVFGFFTLLECSRFLRSLMATKWLQVVGSRSLSKCLFFSTWRILPLVNGGISSDNDFQVHF